MPEPTAPEEAQFDAFIHLVAIEAIRDGSLADLHALADESGPVLLAGLVDPDPASARPMYRAIARMVAEQMPRPSLRYATARYPRPGRNDLCDCGSGRKYKQCCRDADENLPDEPLATLGHLLEALPRKRWAELAGSKVDHSQVEAAAFQFSEEGRHEDVIALLASWFAGTGPIPEAHELLLDLLLDAYVANGNPRKKKHLLEAAIDRGDRTIHSAALQRLATMAADDGDFTAAWRHFRAAQREQPDSPSLAHLEVVLLISQGDEDQARQRARFWIARLQRQDAEAYRELIDFLRQVAEGGESALFDLHGPDLPELAELRLLLDDAPAPHNLHRLARGDAETAGHVEPMTELALLVARWQEVFPQIGPALTAMGVDEHPAWDDTHDWLAWLRGNPLLWQSFDVLDDLALALTALPAFGIEQALGAPIIARAERLFDLLLQADDPQGRPIEWHEMKNRPALRLLAQAIVPDLDAPGDTTLKRIERYLTLNPNDNHGFRNDLMSGYLRRGRYEQAIELVTRFDQDTELQFGKALALWASDRANEALPVLQQAHAALPRLLPMLAAKSPRKPALHPEFIQYGGADQAWLFRERELENWQAIPGALDWLRKTKRALR